ncbi:MAG: dCMP deaminase family protein [bacterium]
MLMDHISWDEYFMGVAALSAKRSKDPSTKVGCCIVNEDKKIIGIGYNGFPVGVDDKEFPWGNTSENWLETKYPYVVHAEANAILNTTSSCKNATIYVTLFPCNECAKLIIQSGMKELIYMDNKYKDTDNNIASQKMLEAAKVKITKMKKVSVDING